eukprot:88409-Chlamydomonas_euryale.AAC.2
MGRKGEGGTDNNGASSESPKHPQESQTSPRVKRTHWWVEVEGARGRRWVDGWVEVEAVKGYGAWANG